MRKKRDLDYGQLVLATVYSNQLLAESYARELSQHTETLYLILRKGMEESEKNHNSILYAIIDLTKPNTPDSPARFLIEVSDDSSE